MKNSSRLNPLEVLNKEIVDCRLCPRLVEYRENVPPRASFRDQKYWRRPIPGFGDPDAWMLILGLAPAAHGGNRTGRIFTGDESGRFLMGALFKEGFANQANSDSREDGLILKGCYMTAAVKCVPPQNKPNPEERLNCSRYYLDELGLLHNLKCILALGKLAFDAYKFAVKARGLNSSNLTFKHGARYQIKGMPDIYASYHPSPQNTYTGLFTEKMLCSLLRKIKTDHTRI